MNWKKGPTIGRGSSATVSLATTATGDLFAVKSVELSSSQFLQKEQQILSQLNSPHVIKYIGFDVNIDNYNLFMEYAPRGTISDMIKKQGGRLQEGLIKSYTRQLLLGLDYLHSNNLVHCDIKCQNVLIANEGIKIGDFGCAKFAENDTVGCSVFSGTPVFMAPEVARGEEQGFAADVWAVGCVVIEMATGCNPWPEVNNPVAGLYRIGYSGEVPLFPAWLSVEGKDFLNKCLRVNAEERWTAEELLQHPFVEMKSFSEKIETFSRNSPSSILDQGFWDSFEAPEPLPAVTRFVDFSGEAPVDRVRQLVEGTFSCLPNWGDEEEWMTVRTNNIENVDEEEDNTELTHMDSFSEEELSSSSVRMMLESDVVGMSGVSVVVSRFLDCMNMNNKNNSNCLLIDSNLSFVSLALISVDSNRLIGVTLFAKEPLTH